MEYDKAALYSYFSSNYVIKDIQRNFLSGMLDSWIDILQGNSDVDLRHADYDALWRGDTRESATSGVTMANLILRWALQLRLRTSDINKNLGLATRPVSWKEVNHLPGKSSPSLSQIW